MGMENFLGDTGKYDTLGVLNGFRKLSELYINQLVEEGKWFTVCHKIDNNQVDIMGIQNDSGEKLGSIVSSIFEESSYRSAIYKYLMMNYLCYIEVPSVSFKTDTGDFKKTFDKHLITSNPQVIADWLGVSFEDLDQKYKSRVFGIDMDDGDDLLPYVKLTETKGGVRKVTCPRSNIDISERGTRVIPLFMLKAGVDALYSKLKSGVTKVSFLKDGGQVREMFASVDFPRIKEIYGQCDFYDNAVMLSYDGDFIKNPSLSRGYIRVPEIGGSRYDTPTRSINYARIISISYNEEPDLAFINIDLSVVVGSFQDCVVKHGKHSKEIADQLEVFELDMGYWKENEKGYTREKSLQSLLEWVESMNMLYSTVFLRDLSLFMLANVQWFSDFDGSPKYSYNPSSNDVGLA